MPSLKYFYSSMYRRGYNFTPESLTATFEEVQSEANLIKDLYQKANESLVLKKLEIDKLMESWLSWNKSRGNQLTDDKIKSKRRQLMGKHHVADFISKLTFLGQVWGEDNLIKSSTLEYHLTHGSNPNWEDLWENLKSI